MHTLYNTHIFLQCLTYLDPFAQNMCADLRRVLLSEPDVGLDGSDGNEPEDNFSSLKGAVVDHEAAENLPTGLSIGRLR